MAGAYVSKFSLPTPLLVECSHTLAHSQGCRVGTAILWRMGY